MADIVEFPKIEKIDDPSTRWKAVIEYRSEDGPQVVTCHFEEFTDLGDMIEHGKNWNTIIRIEVSLNRYSADIPRLTVEQSEMI